ncbi:MAG: DUF2007 domain-containing protein [Chloroflexi bacterium]|nr:DUF2007 domain-containing protein [Chloroflexota bacterium]
MPNNGWVTLLEVFDRLEAEILKVALETQGIPAQLFQEGISHYLYPVSGPMGKIELCVPAERLEDALSWLSAYNNGDLLNYDQEESVDPNDA